MRRALAVPALMLFLGWSAAAHAAIPQPVRFWTNVSTAVAGSSLPAPPLVVRPKRILLFNDGRWGLEHLRWTGWGTSVAKATGTSVSRDDGKVTKTRAQVTLSNPGRFRGHEVYRCFQLTVPPPASDMNLCLRRLGKVWLLLTPQVKETEFLAPSMQGGCSMSAEQVVCESYAAPQQLATLKPDGAVSICSGTAESCRQGNFGEGTPRYDAGRTVTSGPFKCEVLDTGVRCTLTATGHGFLMSAGSTVKV